jgi:hypothetical protein
MQRAARAIMLAGLSALLAACPGPDPVKPPEPPAPKFDSMDQLNQDLAKRAADKLTFNVDDYRVIVTEAGFEPGTLLQPQTARVESWDACAPGERRLPLLALPSMFPDYAVSNRVAASFGLDEAVLSGLASAKVDVESSRAVTLSFRNVKARFLANDQMRQVLPSCQAALASGEHYLVRGEIIGQRSLAMKRALKAGAAVEAATIGNVAITPVDGAAAVAINDEAPVQFLQIIAVVRPPAAPGGAPQIAQPQAVPQPPPQPTHQITPPPPVSAGPGRGPASVPAPAGIIYVQRDAADASGAAAAVVAALKGQGLNVARAVEAIPHDRMPAEAQVRYFNAADRGAGEAALALLRVQFPQAKLRKVGLKAPAGQLEVWLPRAG